MPKLLITTCPHCKKDFEEDTFSIPCGGVKYGPDPRTPYKSKLPKYKRCTNCGKLSKPEEYKYRYEDVPDPVLSIIQKRLKNWINKLLP